MNSSNSSYNLKTQKRLNTILTKKIKPFTVYREMETQTQHNSEKFAELLHSYLPCIYL